MSESNAATKIEQKTATLVKVATDCYVRVEPRIGWGRYTDEQRYKEMAQWVHYFEEFLRDHRSQDVQSMDVVQEWETQCSECGCTDEPMSGEAENGEDPDKLYCNGCGAEIVK